MPESGVPDATENNGLIEQTKGTLYDKQTLKNVLDTVTGLYIQSIEMAPRQFVLWTGRAGMRRFNIALIRKCLKPKQAWRIIKKYYQPQNPMSHRKKKR